MIQPHVLQRHALHGMHQILPSAGRGVVVMPCGSGKTLLGRWFAEQTAARLTVVFVPSLALVPQTVLAYREGAIWRHETLIVCSDPTSGRAVGVGDLDLPPWARTEVTASTSERVIRGFLTGAGPRLIVSTYHSAPRVAAALSAAATTADLVVCDETHRLTGRPRAEFRAVLNDNALPARQRLFLTATPVEAAAWGADADVDGVAAPLTLDDESLFGPTLYRAGFAEAVAAGLLVDYDVDVLAVPDEQPDDRAGQPVGDTAAIAAVLAAARDGATRILSFHSRIRHATGLVAALDGRVLPDGRVIRAEHVEAKHPAWRRGAALDRLANPEPGEVRVLASARTLSEGINVPAVDTVVFAEPRTSAVDIVQAVGRAMRLAPGKQRGRVVLAVTTGEDLDPDTELGSTRWRHVWTVLRALADMDERFAATLRSRLSPGGPGGARRSPNGPGLRFDVPAELDLDQWLLRTLDRTGGAWWHRHDLLADWAREHGHARPPASATREKVDLARWVQAQRTAHSAGQLAPDRVEALQALPGWARDAWEVGWWTAAAAWAQHAPRLAQVPPAERVAALTEVQGWVGRRAGRGYSHLADFVLDTCARHRRGQLPPHLAAAAGRLPGWRWRWTDDDDAAMVDALALYAADQDDLNPVHTHRAPDGRPLGAWLTAVRRRRYTGRLHPSLELELLLLEQAGMRLHWDTAATGWRLGYLALRQFADREGTARVPYQHVEALPDYQLDLSRWCTVQRQDHRRGVLPEDRRMALEQISGWRWEVSPYRGADADGVIAFADPTLHGQRLGYAKGCRCDPCTTAHTAAFADRRRSQGAGSCDLVDAEPARRHLMAVQATGVSADAMARVSGLNSKTLDAVLAGQRARVRPETAAALLAVTSQAAAAVDRSAFGPHGELVDARPTWKLIDWMVLRGWPRAWISREIGQSGRALQLKRDRISVTNADKVAELDRRLGRTRRPPPRRSNRIGGEPLPTLDELLAAEQEAS